MAITSEVVAFLDDDTELIPNYFEELIKTFADNPEISGVGGVAINENGWSLTEPNKKYDPNRYFQFEGFVYKEGQRNVMRNYLGLQSNLGPGRMPEYSHGKTCGFPLNGKIYEVDLLIGMSFAFRKKVFDSLRFSTYFEGYGLYEDADFSIRALQFGKNVINTKVQLSHYHHPPGRPNQYKYGKMVVQKWLVCVANKESETLIKCKIKVAFYHYIVDNDSDLVIHLPSNKKEAFTEALGRTVGWWSLLLNKPNVLK